MTLPASGTMTAAMINVELGRASTAPFNINGTEERALAGVPSGTIRFSDFYGKSAVTLTATAKTVVALNPITTCVAGIRFLSGGSLQRRQNATYTAYAGEWCDPQSTGIGSDYDIYAQIISQSGVSSSSGTFGSWLNLGSNREWNISRTTVGTATRTIRFSFSPAGAGSSILTIDITLQATRS